ncbi:RTA1 like protein-domain-containing protein [Dactylonectria estremocensis]|uniref:RTA1 like protein-domain-containing protein n=1 Tax=Dactylonectria estremocensis TaxID=1079267 RepID=A0A9P9F0S5_9HYPO|nr:RTA1 like protein-domain-containing protein [Dactylonectria estremocensis]
MATIDNLFGYDANEILPVVAAVLVAISLLGHIYQNQHYQFWKVTFFMFYAGLFYTIGWVVRCISIQHPGNLPLFMIQSIFIYLGPPIYSAAEYNTLGRLMHYLPMHAIINPNRIVYIFIFLGSLVEIFTAIGGSWMAAAQGKDDRGLMMDGALLMAIAVVLQGVVEVVFIGMTGILHHRCVKSKMMPRNVRTMFVMLYGTSTLIIIRCVFRAVETFQLRSIIGGGSNSSDALLKHEWPLYVFETLPVLIYTYWLNIIHPGRFIPNNPNQYLDFDGKTERMGPGWVHKRAWFMFVLDPFDFIGMASMQKRDKFYLEPERWAEVKESFAQGKGSNAGAAQTQPVDNVSMDGKAKDMPSTRLLER